MDGMTIAVLIAIGIVILLGLTSLAGRFSRDNDNDMRKITREYIEEEKRKREGRK